MKTFNNKKHFTFCLLAFTILPSSFILFKDKRPTLYIIGDSTVKNGQGTGGGGLWGWGDMLTPYVDTTKLRVENDALGGTSSRTFQTKGLWDKVWIRLSMVILLSCNLGITMAARWMIQPVPVGQ